MIAKRHGITAILCMLVACNTPQGAATVAPPGTASDTQQAGAGQTEDSGADDSAAKRDRRGAEPDAAARSNAFADDGTVEVQPPDAWVTDTLKLPRGLHMTWQHATDTTVTIQWSTLFLDTAKYTPKVWFAPAKTLDPSQKGADMRWHMDRVKTGVGDVYKETLAGVALAEDDFVVWTVELTGLTPDTNYAFRAGTWAGFDTQTGHFDTPNLGQLNRFRTAPKKGKRKPLEFVIAGDSRGGTDKIKANMGDLMAMDAAFWLFSGDMNPSGRQVEWHQWFDAMGPLLRARPLMPIQGNHEIFADIYYRQFALPRAKGLDKSLAEHAWSMDYANLHIVGLDSNAEELMQAQIGWLDKDLGHARKDPDIDWIIVFFHHAAYSASHHGSTKRVQQHWVPLFDKHHVDLVANGHDHNYERTWPLRHGKKAADGEGVVYVVAGAFYAPGYSNGKQWWTVTSTHGKKGNYAHVAVDGKSLTLTAWAGDHSAILDVLTLKK